MQYTELSLISGDLNERKEGLEERLVQRERELEEAGSALSKTEAELERVINSNQELSLDLEDEESKRHNMLEENQEQNLVVERLNKQLLDLKTRFMETTNQLAKARDDADTDMDEQRRKLEKKVRRLEDEKVLLRDELEAEIDLVRKETETKKEKEVKEMETRLQSEQVKYEDEIDFCNQVIENLRARNNETMVMAENTRSAADRMTETDGSSSAQRIQELVSKVQDLEDKLTYEKKENVLSLEKEKSSSVQLRSDLKRMKTKLEDALEQSGREKTTLKEEIKRVKAEKDKADLQFYQIKERLADYEAEVENLRSELKQAEDKLQQLGQQEGRRSKEVEDLQSEITKKNKKIQESIREKHTEVETLERRVEVFERSERQLKEEISEIKEIIEIQTKEKR